MKHITRIMSAAAAAAGLITLLTGCLRVDPTEPEISQLPAGGKRVLFIGNSLTYTNSLPHTVAGLADASGDTIRALQVALPNFAVIDHVLGLSNAVDVIRSQPWDYVVLQQGPTTTQLNRDTLIIAAKLFDPHVKAAGGRTAVLMPWPQMHQPHLFDAVRQSALLASQSVEGGLFLPVGEAWRTAREADPSIELYGSDGYHPGPLGTYLAALVIYERVTGKDARQLPGTAIVSRVPLAVPEGIVRFLQLIAHETVARFPDPAP